VARGLVRLAATIGLAGQVGCGARSELSGFDYQLPCEAIEARARPVCDDVELTDLPPRPLSDAASGSVIASSCDFVHVFAGASTMRSTDGGATFGPAFALPRDTPSPRSGWPRWASATVTEGGRIHALAERDGQVQLYSSDGAAWEPPVAVARASPALLPEIVARGDDEVVVWWRRGTFREGGGLVEGLSMARSKDGGGTFEEAIPIDDGAWLSVSYGSLCLAGADAVAVSYMVCNGVDCSGDNADATERLGFAALSIEEGPFEATALYSRENDWFGAPPQPEVACNASGVVLLAWPGASNRIHTAAATPCGAVVVEAGSVWDGASPTLTLGETRGLVRYINGLASGFAGIDLAAKVSFPPTLLGDVDGDGVPDRLADVCALTGDRFAAVATSAPSAGDGLATALVIGAAGAIERQVALGPFRGGTVAQVACDRRGRAHVLWSNDGIWYARLAPDP
jgi:hypothetical protein